MSALAAVISLIILGTLAGCYRTLTSPLPLIGNLHQLQCRGWVRQSREWHKKYGPLVTLKLGQRTAVLIGNQEVANELLGKRGRIYSSRPHLTLAFEIMSKCDHTLFLPYGPKWRAHNRLHMSFLNPRAVRQYRAIQELESLETLHQLLTDDNHERLFKRFQTSLIHTLAYGTRITDAKDSRIKELEEVARGFLEAVATGDWWVDSFPILKHVPSCFASWKRYADRIHWKTVKMNGANISAAEKGASWNWVKHVRGLKGVETVSEHELVFVFGSIYQAGVDIMTSSLRLFLMACILHPEAVSAAQEELQRVLGNNRLPNFKDMDNLPFIDAFIKEVLRWRPLAAIGAPHSLTEEDSYLGFVFPKDTIILANQFAMDMDRNAWSEPELFRPERWIENPTRTLSSFGFGRRKCVGQYMAMDSLYIMITRILWAYDIKGGYKDSEGSRIGPWDFVEEGNVLIPKPFHVDLRIRDEQRRGIIQSALAATEGSIDHLLAECGREISKCFS
ncbi:cytochrome P450 [Aspergillus alliaceus]|uniref:Cytochrome P450 n=1 Tax=Petromyces alliaceus TaxID=209559 RepID=A0A5N7C791_PETAA|nr:cytochrome P450 [Aspergillus alliaceus]